MSRGPYTWFRDHREYREDASGSGFDLGIADNGSPLIHHGGHTGTVATTILLDWIREAKPDAFEEYVTENTRFEEPAEDPDPSPEDVAETWIAATDLNLGITFYYPDDENTEVNHEPGGTFPFNITGDAEVHGSKGELRTDPSGPWNAHVVEAVHCEEVPTDD